MATNEAFTARRGNNSGSRDDCPMDRVELCTCHFGQARKTWLSRSWIKHLLREGTVRICVCFSVLEDARMDDDLRDAELEL